MRLGLALVGGAVALLGCAPATTVVLLPQAGGRTGGVNVSTEAGLQSLTVPYQSAQVSSTGAVSVVQLSPTEVMSRYGALLVQAPPAPAHFTLYFETGGAALTDESAAQLADILALARARAGGEIVLTGHTDRVGSAAANDALSLQRAQAIRAQLVAQGFKPELIDAIGRGEREPLVPTADEVAEPRNRRVEVEIR